LDFCWDGSCNQDDVYNQCASKSVTDVFDGYNGTIFAYGQTGSGKSWSMMGDKNSEELKGIIPRSADAIFTRCFNDQSGTQYTVSCSYLQVYRETIGDLLNPAKQNLPVREHPSKGVYVDGLTQTYVASYADIMDVLTLGDSARAVASTNMNAVSSRSHSVFIMQVSQKTEEGSTKTGRLNLVDLAGSEKIGKTGAQGETLEEAKKINQSLSALGNVIKSLADGKGHVPYRDSKLTRLVRPVRRTHAAPRTQHTIGQRIKCGGRCSCKKRSAGTRRPRCWSPPRPT
jgi:kinesin family protein 5